MHKLECTLSALQHTKPQSILETLVDRRTESQGLKVCEVKLPMNTICLTIYISNKVITLIRKLKIN